jgi:leader peptidase (prepilin peptidase)/N-methyltransferase
VVWFGAIGLAAFAALSLILDPVAAGFTAFLAVAMAAITWSDVRAFIVPDVLSLPSIPIGMAANSLVIHQNWDSGLLESLWGAIIGGGALYLVRYTYFRLRNVEGLGLGDVKLAAVAGAWLGPGLLAPACLAATLTALLAVLLLKLSGRAVSGAQLHIPFGSFIAPVILLFWGFRLWDLGLPVT